MSEEKPDQWMVDILEREDKKLEGFLVREEFRRSTTHQHISDQRKIGLLTGFLSGLRFEVSPELCIQIDKVLKEVSE